MVFLCSILSRREIKTHSVSFNKMSVYDMYEVFGLILKQSTLSVTKVWVQVFSQFTHAELKEYANIEQNCSFEGTLKDSINLVTLKCVHSSSF